MERLKRLPGRLIKKVYQEITRLPEEVIDFYFEEGQRLKDEEIQHLQRQIPEHKENR